MNNGLAGFADPTWPVLGAISAVAFGALSLVEPAQLTPVPCQVYRSAVASTTALWPAVMIDREWSMFIPANFATMVEFEAPAMPYTKPVLSHAELANRSAGHAVIAEALRIHDGEPLRPWFRAPGTAVLLHPRTR